MKVLFFILMATPTFGLASEQLRVQVRHGEARCPFCHETIQSSDQRTFCPGCGTAHHDACREESHNCAVDGCGRALADSKPANLNSLKSPVAVAERIAEKLARYAALVESGGSAVEVDELREDLFEECRILLGLPENDHTADALTALAQHVKQKDSLAAVNSKAGSGCAAVGLGSFFGACVGGLSAAASPPAGAAIGLAISLPVMALIYRWFNENSKTPASSPALGDFKKSFSFSVDRTTRGLEHLRRKVGTRYGDIPREPTRMLIWLLERIKDPVRLVDLGPR